MKVINTVEFSEMLQSAPGINETHFFIHSGHVITGDHVIPLFFYTAEGKTWVVENLLGKSPRGIEIHNTALETILQFKTGFAALGEGYFYMATLRYSSVEALQEAQERYETLPVVEFVNGALHALQSAQWTMVPMLTPSGDRVTRDQLEVELSKPTNINLTAIKFYLDGEFYVVLGKGFREEVMLELIRFDSSTRQAYFSGIVAGKPIYQRVRIEEVSFRGDYDFLQWVKTHNFDTGEAGHGLWWIRHMGVSLHPASNSLTLKNPHLSVRGEVKVIPDSYDSINNRTVIL